MPSILQFLGAAVGISYVLGKYAPAYSVGLVSTASLLFLTFILGNVFYWGHIYPNYTSPLINIPRPKGGDFLFDQTRRVLRESSGYPHRDWVHEVKHDGLIRYSTWLRERLLISNPQVLKEMLGVKSYEFVKPEQVRFGLARILGEGVLFAEGDEHKVQRKNLLPAFAYRHVKDLYPIFWEKSRDLIDAVLEDAKAAESVPKTSGQEPKIIQHKPGVIEVGNWISRAALDIIGISGMDRDFNALKDPDNKLSQQYRNVLNPSKTARYLGILGLFVPRQIIDSIPVKDNQNIWNAADYVREVCRDLIAQKRQAIAEKKAVRPDIISIALDSAMFNDEELVNQMMTFLIAGHETTASVMSWAVYLLCRHPEVQTKLRNEIRASIPSLSGDITPAQIDNCHYLKAFCNETLRLWPPVVVTLRVASKDTTLNGQFIPKDTLIILSPTAINQSTQSWGPDASSFKPERWLDAEGRANNSGGADSAYSFLTFLHGPRACIGQKFAEAEFACLVAAWVGKLETTFEEGSPLDTDEPEVRGGVTSRPKHGVWVNLKAVEGW